MYKQRIVPAAEPEIRVQPQKTVIRPLRKHLLCRVKGQRQPLIPGRKDRDDVGEIPRVRAPAFGPLFVRKYFDERKPLHRGGMPAHFQPAVEQVVFLVRLLRPLFHLFKLQIVPPLLADLRDRHHAELETPRFRIVLFHLLPQPQHVEIQNMRITAVAFPRKKIRKP